MPSQTLRRVRRWFSGDPSGDGAGHGGSAAVRSRNQSTRASAAGGCAPVGTGRGEQVVGVAAAATGTARRRRARSSRGPSSRWPRGGTACRRRGGWRSAAARTASSASTSKPSGTVNTSSCHSIHGPAATGGAPGSSAGSYHPISGCGRPADRRRRGRATSTWAPKQMPSSGMPRPTTSRTSAASAATEAGRLGSVDVPLRAERQHEVDAVELRPVGRLLPVAPP